MGDELERVVAGWRLGQPAGVGGDGRPHVDPSPAPGQTLFEAIETSGIPDSETYVLARWDHTFAILNVFPYTPGHVLILPRRGWATIDELTDDAYDELWRLVRTSARAVRAAFRPQGLNIGLNEGSAGGGSVPDHLHVHVVPRWDADTNFMTTVAGARVLPITLADAWQALRAAWPDDGGASSNGPDDGGASSNGRVEA